MTLNSQTLLSHTLCILDADRNMQNVGNGKYVTERSVALTLLQGVWMGIKIESRHVAKVHLVYTASCFMAQGTDLMICGRLAAADCLLYSLIHENLQGCNAYMPNLRSNAATPLHKLDIVQVVLDAS